MFRSFLQSRSIQTHIFWGMLAVILFIVGTTGAFSYIQVQKIIQKTTSRYANETIRQALGRLESSLNEIERLTQVVSRDTRIQRALEGGSPSNEVLAQVREAVTNLNLQSPYVQYAEVYHQQNILYPFLGQSIDKLLTEQQLGEVDRNNGKLTWIGYQDVFQSSDLPSIMAVTPIEGSYDTKRIGYLVVYISPALINIMVKDFQLSQGSTIDLFDQKGQVLSSSDNEPDEAKKLEIYQSLSGSKNGSFIRKVDGGSFLLNYQTLSLTNWKLVYQIPYSEVVDPLLNIRRNFIIAGIGGVIMTLLLSILLAKTISGPVINLVMEMREARRGKMSFSPVRTSNLEMNELSRNYQKMVNELNEWIEKVYQAQLLKNQAEKKALQAQINPHFLYNTLDTIRWLLILKDEDEISNLIVDLSKILRYTIGKDDHNGLVPLMDEIEQVTRYLSIQKTRFSDKLTISCHVEDEVRQIRIPKLLLQPVVENAVLHGIEGLEDQGVLQIRGYKDKNYYRLEIEDNGTGMSREQVDTIFKPNPDSETGTGIGLRNVYDRIKLVFGPSGDMRIESEPGRGTKVTLYIPEETSITKGA
ncbi:cache domain-containing sensor histidine kinase [Cohnella soli]|uniref:histidine kinase n=1 Tax=Cohnella soli TaxID=425005 RepID=A0ABW0HJY5_9BACL